VVAASRGAEETSQASDVDLVPLGELIRRTPGAHVDRADPLRRAMAAMFVHSSVRAAVCRDIDNTRRAEPH